MNIAYVFIFATLVQACFCANGTARGAPPCNGKSVKFRLVKDTNKCLDVVNGKAGDGAGVQIWDCNGHTNQLWKWCSDGRIMSLLPGGLVLDVPDNANNLQLWQPSGSAGQYWQYDVTNFSIFPPSTGKKLCMDVVGGSTTNGARVNLYYCVPGSGERWYFGSGPPPAPAPPPVPQCSGGKGTWMYFQLHRDTTKCMHIRGGKAVNGANVEISDCNGMQSQKWVWCSDGRIVSAINDKMCLDVPGGDPSKASSLQMWLCQGSAGQYWQFDGTNMAIYPHATGEKMCVDVDNGSTNPGTLVNLYGCSPGSGEKWQVEPAASEAFVSV